MDQITDSIELASPYVAILSVILAVYAIHQSKKLTSQASQDNERIIKTINASSGQIRKDVSDMKYEIFRWFHLIPGIDKDKLRTRVKTDLLSCYEIHKKSSLFNKFLLKWVSDRRYSGIQGNIGFRPDQSPKRTQMD